MIEIKQDLQEAKDREFSMRDIKFQYEAKIDTKNEEISALKSDLYKIKKYTNNSSEDIYTLSMSLVHKGEENKKLMA